jgi:hypothetical protein
MQLQQMHKSFTLEEVRATVFSFDPSKVTGADGFSFYFINYVEKLFVMM